jgi:hypothetical protein
MASSTPTNFAYRPGKNEIEKALCQAYGQGSEHESFVVLTDFVNRSTCEVEDGGEAQLLEIDADMFSKAVSLAGQDLHFFKDMYVHILPLINQRSS